METINSDDILDQLFLDDLSPPLISSVINDTNITRCNDEAENLTSSNLKDSVEGDPDLNIDGDGIFLIVIPPANEEETVPQTLTALPEINGIDEDLELETYSDIDDVPHQKKTRKRVANPQNWVRNTRKFKHQAGEEYINQKGKVMPKKSVKNKKDCLNSCKLNCSKNITNDERENLFKGYYGLKTQNEKYLYLRNNTERNITSRKTKISNDGIPSRRQFSFKYYFHVKSVKLQVCKTFFLTTLNISQKPIYNVHLKENPETGLPKPDHRGKQKTSNIPEYSKNDVRKHITSFNVVESHYCRADSKKQYLESTLSISKMYDMFKEKHPDSLIKESMYRHIFVTEFNLDFHQPKKDRCDICEEHKVCVKENISTDHLNYGNHKAAKNAMRDERKNDREKQLIPVLCFDLQNVITCPRAEISSFFYMRKLNVYNITAHLKTSTYKKVYCALWTEVTGGRSGNDIASAVYKIIKRIIQDDPTIDELITWADSCVPQNRNQMMSGAMIMILQEYPQIKTITMKYSTPGHGAVQEVDNIHSHIEKVMSKSEFYSPVSLIKILLRVNRKNPYTVIQMMDNDFLDFSVSSREFNFSLIPFTKVCYIRFSKVFGLIAYREVHGGKIIEVNIKPQLKKSARKSGHIAGGKLIKYKNPKAISKVEKLNVDKKRDLTRMERFMPLLDREYYRSIIAAH